VLAVPGMFQHGWVVGARGRQDGDFKFFEEKGLGVHQAKCWASQAFGMAKIKGNSQQTHLFNTTELCSHSQPSQDWPSIHLDTRPLVQIAIVLQKSSHQKQTTQV